MKAFILTAKTLVRLFSGKDILFHLLPTMDLPHEWYFKDESTCIEWSASMYSNAYYVFPLSKVHAW